MKKEATGFRLIFGYLGIFLMFIGLLTGIPLLLLIFYPEEQTCLFDFLIPIAIYEVVGALLYFTLIFKRKKANFMRCEDRHLLFLIWIFAVIAGALPFIFANIYHGLNMNWSEAFFESTSAYSTTGLTCYKDFLDTPGAYCPHVFLFHRAEMQFVGGAGLVLMLASILAGSGGGMSLFSSEGHNDRLMPNVGKTAKIIFGIMTGYMVVGAFALWLAGVAPYEAVVISMCAVSGGGMTPVSTSIAYYRTAPGNGVLPCNPLAIEIITMFLVLLSAISFVLHTLLLTGKWKKFFRDDETKFALILIVVGTVFAGLGACYAYSKQNSVAFGTNAGEAFRDAAFYIVASASTSGFCNTSMADMVALGKPLTYLCIIFMIFGGGVGSCGGGIKQYRIVVCIKDLLADIRYRFSPTHSINPSLTYRYGEMKQLDQKTVKDAHNYALLFLGVFLGITTFLCFLPEIDPEMAMYDVASGMSNTGLSLIDFVAYGQAHPHAYHFLLWALSIGMLLGRLEIMPLVDSVRNYVEEFRYMNNNRRRKKEAVEAE